MTTVDDLTPEQRAKWRKEAEVWPPQERILALLDALDDKDKALATEKARADKAEQEREQAEAERDELARQVGEQAKEASKWRVWRRQDARHISDRDTALVEMTRQRDKAEARLAAVEQERDGLAGESVCRREPFGNELAGAVLDFIAKHRGGA